MSEILTPFKKLAVLYYQVKKTIEFLNLTIHSCLFFKQYKMLHSLKINLVNLSNLSTFIHQPTIATCVEVQMGKGLGADSGESGSTKVAQEL